MAQSSVLRGIATLTFYAADHAAAKKWYSEFFGKAPYFDRPGYFEFHLGAREFGPITQRGQEGSGFAAAAVTDAFGNVIMTNPHYLEILKQKANL